MKDYLALQKVTVPFRVVETTYVHLRQAGRRGVEGVALWAGTENSREFNVKEVIIPKQTALRLEQGLCYIVAEDELHRINVRLFETKLRLVAQVHSHPEDAYHSDTDDLYPMVTKLGCLSVVVPDFAAGQVDLTSWAVFRLTARHTWTRVPPDKAQRLLVIER